MSSPVSTHERTIMKHRVASLMLAAALVGGCATHGPQPIAWDSPTTADGRVIKGDDDAGAIAANIVYAPGHALLCGAAGITAGVVMVITLGQSYDEASKFMHGACNEPWILRPSDIREAVPLR
jgi:hypothetical protein